VLDRRSGDMSSACRQFGTRNVDGSHKLLIVNVSATVAEGRHESRLVTQPNNKRKRHKAHANSKRGTKITLFVAQLKIEMEPNAARTRVLEDWRPGQFGLTLFPVVLLRHYIEVYLSLIIARNMLFSDRARRAAVSRGL